MWEERRCFQRSATAGIASGLLGAVAIGCANFFLLFLVPYRIGVATGFAIMAKRWSKSKTLVNVGGSGDAMGDGCWCGMESSELHHRCRCRFVLSRSHCDCGCCLLLLLFPFSVGRCFVHFFRGLLGSSESEFVFDLEFVVKNYFKINLSFVHFFQN